MTRLYRPWIEQRRGIQQLPGRGTKPQSSTAAAPQTGVIAAAAVLTPSPIWHYCASTPTQCARSNQWRAPLLGGLLFSTLFTLVVIPVVYYAVTRLAERIGLKTIPPVVGLETDGRSGEAVGPRSPVAGGGA